jgi:hypothetical protein
MIGLARIMTALWMNHRYRFTTWRLGWICIILLVVGAVLKVAMLWR